ncbi:MAG: DUF1893 domain-containing protein [Bacteroides sp.]|nr:DUF1893 domain-containing protein [Bacteroides sp.]
MDIDQLIEILHRDQCSCVVANGNDITCYHRRGVADLLSMLHNEPGKLVGAMIADKVIGKGAAALMVLGGIRQAYADVISTPALELLKRASIVVTYGTVVSNIINRLGTGICPVEQLCAPCATAAECLPLIEQFISEQQTKQ